MSDKRIKVACRMRPKITRERYDLECCRKADDTTVVITEPSEDNEKPRHYTYSFDYVFDATDAQGDIYEEAALDLVDSTLEGFNATIFAYGQTGSGKTYTILGQVDESSETLVSGTSGLFLRSLNDLFVYKKRAMRDWAVTITLSIIEIYNENLFDLLNNKTKLQIREVNDDVQMPNLKQVEVATSRDVYKYFQIANAQRSVSATQMNKDSSRSHAVFLVDLVQTPQSADFNPLLEDKKGKQKGAGKERRSRLSLVDLAGSERVKKSGVEGKELLEAQAINKSLSCLGTVVNGMYQDAKHIPFRDSKLTRLLRTSFTETTSKVLLIANMSPVGGSFQETRGTLQFADRVKGLKAGAVSMYDPLAEQEYLAKLKLAEEICCDLRICGKQHDYVAQRPRKHMKGLDRKTMIQRCVDAYRENVAKTEQLKKQKEADDVKQMVQDETNAVINSWREKIQKLEQDLQAAILNHASLVEELKTCETDKQQQIDDTMKDAKKYKRARRNGAERIEKVTVERDAAVKEFTKLNKEKEKLEKRLLHATAEQDKDWQDWQGREDGSDTWHAKCESFIGAATPLQHAHLEMLKTRIANLPMDRKVAGLRYENSFLEIQELVESTIDTAINRATSGKYAASMSNSSLTKTSSNNNTWVDDEGDDDDEVANVKVKPKGYTQSDVHVQMNRANVAFHNGADSNAPPTPYDEEEADRQYLMGIYDTEGLIRDIIRYLQSGNVLLKHGRQGKPHNRKFWISDNLKELCWVDNDQSAQRPKKSSVDLKDVVGITLGQYTKVFRRNSGNADADFYFSWSVKMRSKRTVDVIAETVSDFEAWLIGLSHVMNMEPQWGLALDITNEEGYNRLQPKERELCGKNHIMPGLFLKLKELVEERRDEVSKSIDMFNGDMEKVYTAVGGIHPPAINKHKALYMTKGELRYLANIDIFRTCIIWKLFEAQNLIFDPNFKPPTATFSLK